MSRLDFPATTRNREPIRAALAEVIRPGARVLEVASGSGQHAAWLAPRLEVQSWQPTDPDPRHRASIAAWTTELSQVEPPIDLDTTEPWPVQGPYDLLLCINMVHISPWEATLGLLEGARRVLPPGGWLALYGPYRVGGAHTAPSNAAFDQGLRRQDPRWGLRDLERVCAEASARGLAHDRTLPMPANNQTVLLRRQAD